MKKIISVKPVTELELQFEDGKSLQLVFDMQALSNFYSLPEGLASFLNENSLVERCAMIIYIGGLEHDSRLTIEKARSIVSNMDPASITEVVSEFSLSMGAANNQMLQELQKKTMQEFLEKLK
jgi:hypothetical protein